MPDRFKMRELPTVETSAAVQMPGRVHERKMGCYNCKWWDCGALATKHYVQCLIRDTRALMETGMPFAEAENRVRTQTRLMAPPRSGLCLVGAAGAEFTMPAYLCDKWTGRVAVEGSYDPLAEELRDKIGDTP